jgi:phage-related tail protein
MATEGQSSAKSSSGGRSTGGNGQDQGRGGAVVAGAQDAASRVKTAAADVAERVPAAASSAQAAVNETARTLDELPDQTLMLGAAFSLGLGVGMFLTGTNRLVVLLAMVPAAAMAATLLNREAEPGV